MLVIFFLENNLENIDYKNLHLCYSSFGKLTLVVLFFSMSFTLRKGGSPADSVVKNLLVNAGDLGLIPGSGRSPLGGHGNPLQYSCWRLPWTEEPGELQSIGSQKSQSN